jgi:hypothetical protein
MLDLRQVFSLTDFLRNHKELVSRVTETINPDENRWELCSRVLSRKDVVEKLSEAW